MDKTNFTLDEIKNDCSEIELKILEMYLNRKKQKEMIQELNITRSKIDHFVARYGLTRFRDRNNYCLDESVISIDNPEFCYFLGFFAADGNVHLTNSGSEIVQFTLKDREPLEDIVKLFRYTGEIKKYAKSGSKNPDYFLGITNKKLVSSLKEIFGEVYRKTHIIQYPKFPNKSCESMFIRGYWDGDGCFTLSKNGRTYIGEAYCDSYDFLDGFCKCMYDNNIHFTRSENTVRFLSQEGTSDFINYIYSFDSCIGLPRKRGLALLHLYYCKKMI